MRYRLNKKQIEMLANGKELTNRNDKIVAPRKLQSSLKILLEENLLDNVDIFIETTNSFPKEYEFKIKNREN